MISVIRHFGIIPFFKGMVPGWSVEEMTSPDCWFTEDEDGGTLGPWDWKIDCVREGDIAYGKFLGGKAAFATVEFYRHLMNWRRSLSKYSVVTGEARKISVGNLSGGRLPGKNSPVTGVLAPAVLDAIRKSGSLEAGEIRKVCSEAAGSPVRKNVADSVLQFLQMGTWSVIGDFRRVYRGPDLSYSGWQRASNTTPEELFRRPGSDSADAPFWARMIDDGTRSGSLELDCAPFESRDFLVSHIMHFFPDADREKLESKI